MGTVYDVEDTTIGKRYVLKTLHPQLGARDDVARRMQKEARTLARLNHSNIVEVFTAGVTGDDLRLPYYVMERLNGQSLRVVLEKKGQLELPHAFHIGIDLLDALDHAHDKGVIHRDVKPDNIFLHRTPAGVTVTKLLDFGILSLLDSSLRETAGRFLGTLRYSAPEQLRGERPTAKVDVYAAGLVLYEIIAGCGPFDDETDPQAIGAAHLHKPPPMLSTFVSVPPEVEALVMASLEKDPDARPRDAFAFAANLRRLKRNLSGSHGRESTEDRSTAAGLVGPESGAASYVEVRVPSSDGPYVISPSRELRSPTQTGFPNTTLHGVPRPTIPPPSANHSVAGVPTATTPQEVDRLAPTHGFAPDTLASPKHGTQPFGLGTRASSAPSVAPIAPSEDHSHIHWPDERISATSEEPQVQTLSIAAPRSLHSAAKVAGAVAMLGMVVVAAILLFAWRPPSAGLGTRASEGATLAPPPAPTRTSPATPASPVPSGGPIVPGESTSASAPKSALGEQSTATPRRKPKPAASSGATATAPALRPDRPGPGF